MLKILFVLFSFCLQLNYAQTIAPLEVSNEYPDFDFVVDLAAKERIKNGGYVELLSKDKFKEGDVLVPSSLLPLARNLIHLVENPGTGKGIVSSARTAEDLAEKLFKMFYIAKSKIKVLSNLDLVFLWDMNNVVTHELLQHTRRKDPGWKLRQKLRKKRKLIVQRKSNGGEATTDPAIIEQFRKSIGIWEVDEAIGKALFRRDVLLNQNAYSIPKSERYISPVKSGLSLNMDSYYKMLFRHQNSGRGHTTRKYATSKEISDVATISSNILKSTKGLTKATSENYQTKEIKYKLPEERTEQTPGMTSTYSPSDNLRENLHPHQNNTQF